MRTIILALLGALLLPGADNVERVFRFANIQDTRVINEAATVIRAVADIRYVTVEPTERKLTVRGTPDQIALATWLFSELDRPANDIVQTATPLEYRLPADNEDPEVRILPLAGMKNSQEVSELATNIRAITDTRRLFQFNSADYVVLRGTSAQVAAAAWLAKQLDRSGPAAGTYQYPAASHPDGDSVLRVVSLSESGTLLGFQEKAALIRVLTDIRRLFTCNFRRSLTIRGTAAQVAFADWLIQEIDQDNANQGLVTASWEYSAAGADSASAVRIFFLPPTTSSNRVSEFAKELRQATGIGRIFPCTERKAIGIRGPAPIVAIAEQLYRERFPDSQ